MCSVLVVEPERRHLTERRRARAGVDHDVVDRAVGAAHQLGLSAAAAPVHPAHDPARAARLRVLHERVGIQPHGPRVGGVEGAGEEAALVPERGGDEQQHAVEARRLHLHGRRPYAPPRCATIGAVLEPEPAASAGRTTAGSCSTSATSPRPSCSPRSGTPGPTRCTRCGCGCARGCGLAQLADDTVVPEEVLGREPAALTEQRRAAIARGGRGAGAAPRRRHGGGVPQPARRHLARRPRGRTGSPRCRSGGGPTSSSTRASG